MYYIIFFLLFFLYYRFLLFVILFPMQSMWGAYQNHKKSIIFKLLSVPYKILNKSMKGGGERYVLFYITTIPSVNLRKLCYKCLGCHISRKVIFHYKTEIRAPWNLRIGTGTIIGDGAILDARSGLTIGENVNLSSNVSIYTLQHDHRMPDFSCPKNRNMEVKIGNRVWLGSNVIVLPGVTIGEGAVCCAGCVVTKDVEPFSVVAGIPAKKVSERPRNLEYNFDGKSCMFY